MRRRTVSTQPTWPPGRTKGRLRSVLSLPPAKVVTVPSSKLVLAEELKGLAESEGKEAAPSRSNRDSVTVQRAAGG